MEEIDLCWRIKNSGYRIVYCGDSEVYHVGGGTLSNESGGSVSISTASTTMNGTPTVTVFNGLIHNKSGSSSFWSYGLMTLENGATGGFQLDYDGQTGSFATGQTVTGQTSGANRSAVPRPPLR